MDGANTNTTLRLDYKNVYVRKYNTTQMTNHEKILELLSDGEKHHSDEICSAWIGGRQGGSRISELRAMRNPDGSKKYNIQGEDAQDGKKGKVYWMQRVPEQGQLLKVQRTFIH